MRGEEKKLTNILEGAKTRFIIPVYQRNYDWKKEHCQRLFDDLEEVVRDKKNGHFFGSIVSGVAAADERVIIDGQQRITTIFLLFLALIHQLQSGVIKSHDDKLVEKITEMYLIDKWHPDDQKLKLKLIKDDQDAFLRVYQHQDDLIKESNVTQNYKHFLGWLENMAFTPDELFIAIEKLIVIDIQLGEKDDAQLVFESLNSTGLDLNEGDKIRNYILMGLESSIQEEYYTKYWNKIEKNTGYDVSTFIRDFLAARKFSTPTIKKVYMEFREYMHEYLQKASLEALLADILKYSKYMYQITNADTPYPKSNSVISRLNLLEMTVTNPFLLSVMDYAIEGNISDEELSKVLKAIEIYLFRRWVCNVPTNALNKVFETLHRDVIKTMKLGEDSDYSNVLNYILLHKDGSSRFPDDNEFCAEMERRNFYQIQNKKKYLYDRLINGNTREHVDVIGGIENELLSIEHIMPQALSLQWKQRLGSNYQGIHEKWLHRLANLTLTGYNGEMSNKSFTDKRDAAGGFRYSGFRINKWIAEQEKWTEEELLKRNEMLKQDFLMLWPLVNTTAVIKEQINEIHSLDEDFIFTNRKISAYNFMGTRYAVKTWVDMLIGVMRLLGEMDAPALIKLSQEEKYPGSYFSDVVKDGYGEVLPDVYVFFSTSTQAKIDIITSVFDRLGLEYSELSFEVY